MTARNGRDSFHRDSRRKTPIIFIINFECVEKMVTRRRQYDISTIKNITEHNLHKTRKKIIIIFFFCDKLQRAELSKCV